jgi:hypothetical protein
MRSTKARHSGEYIASLSLMSDGILSARSFPGRKFPCRGDKRMSVRVCVRERERERECVWGDCVRMSNR